MAMNFDVLIANGKIIDGTGNPWYKADIGIKESKIVRIRKPIKDGAYKIIDAQSLDVAPGFIDTHSHSGLMLLAEPLAEAKLRQGITTEVVGVDGLSPTPIRSEYAAQMRKYLAGLDGNPNIDWDWTRIRDYLHKVERAGPGTNVAALAGNGAIRLTVIGFEDRPATPREIQQMREVTEQCVLDGAFGVSSGLIYPPSMFADTNELIEICKVVARYDGCYVTHMRGESDALIQSVEEAITIGEKSGCKVIISHFKAVGKDNWGKVKETIRMVNEARARGIDVTCDQYPYTAGSTMLSALLPPWSLSGGIEKMLHHLRDPATRERLKKEIYDGLPRWEDLARIAGWNNIIVSYCKNNKDFEGKNLAEIASIKGKDPADSLFEILLDENAEASMILHLASEDDVRTIMQHPAVMVCTDGLMGGKPHPRLYGACPRILGHYVREEKLLRLEEAIRKMTSLPATRLGIRDRGLIAEGMYADITIFNPDTIIDKGTYQDPRQFPDGIEYVLVNGQLAVEHDQRTETRSGKALRKKLV